VLLVLLALVAAEAEAQSDPLPVPRIAAGSAPARWAPALRLVAVG